MYWPFIKYWQREDYMSPICAFASSKAVFCFPDKTHSTVMPNRTILAFSWLVGPVSLPRQFNMDLPQNLPWYRITLRL